MKVINIVLPSTIYQDTMRELRGGMREAVDHRKEVTCDAMVEFYDMRLLAEAVWEIQYQEIKKQYRDTASRYGMDIFNKNPDLKVV
jgi:isopentenyl diphosphate isomerase/L-lactate dehydrogenase-like FMN-dependent dehydrogenase